MQLIAVVILKVMRYNHCPDDLIKVWSPWDGCMLPNWVVYGTCVGPVLTSVSLGMCSSYLEGVGVCKLGGWTGSVLTVWHLIEPYHQKDLQHYQYH